MDRQIEGRKLLFYGASGHAKVVCDAAEQMGCFEIIGFLDDDPAVHGRKILGYPVLGGRERLTQYSPEDCALVIAIGSNEARREITRAVRAQGFAFARIVHPKAQLGHGVSLGEGTVVMAGAVINVDAQIGEHAIVNTGATIDHDCTVGDFAHISPGAHLAGGVRVGLLAQVGIGASVIQNVTIGEGTIVGAGAVVVSDLPDHVTAVGMPARVVEIHNEEASQR
jgi:acetyltransferase EpsM